MLVDLRVVLLQPGTNKNNAIHQKTSRPRYHLPTINSTRIEYTDVNSEVSLPP